MNASGQNRAGKFESRPLVSVIVPSYNKPEYLPECLRSIQNQTFTDWECIVVSDGSPRVEEIRAAVASMDDPRFRLVEHERNCGPAVARNTGIREARGDFLIYVDEDDYIASDCLHILLSRMGERSVQIVCPQGRYFGGRDGLLACSAPSMEQILVHQPLLLVGSLIRKTVFDFVGIFDEHPLINMGREDHEWWIRVIAAGVSLSLIREELYFVRRLRGEEDWDLSLNFRTFWNDYVIYKHIVSKHRRLYEQMPEARKAVLRKAMQREALWFKTKQMPWSAVGRLWLAAILFGNKADFRRAADEFLELVLGRRLKESVLSAGRRLMGRKTSRGGVNAEAS